MQASQLTADAAMTASAPEYSDLITATYYFSDS
jgi:hypothetical protein